MTDFKLDHTMMFAVHDALRRDLDQVARTDGRTEGWDLFDRMLHMHHTIEDDLLWPLVRGEVGGQRDDLALLDTMETEHAAIVPLLETIDKALANGDAMPPEQAELDTRVRDHLTHEERDVVPLIDRSLSEEQWMTFGGASAQRVGAEMPTYLPWVLEGLDGNTTAHLLGILPPPVRQTYEDEWRPAFAAVDWWAAKRSVP